MIFPNQNQIKSMIFKNQCFFPKKSNHNHQNQITIIKTKSQSSKKSPKSNQITTKSKINDFDFVPPLVWFNICLIVDIIWFNFDFFSHPYTTNPHFPTPRHLPPSMPQISTCATGLNPATALKNNPSLFPPRDVKI